MSKTLTPYVPWTDHAGRFSVFKAAVFLALFYPLLSIFLLWANDRLGMRPVTTIIHETGDWAVRFLLLSVAITPLRRLLRWPELLSVRRMIGVAAFAYVFFHFLLYVADQKFALLHVASEIVLRVYLAIGFIALLGLGALAATSTDAMQRRMGGKNWSRLHRLVHVLVVLGIVHYFMQSKVNVADPVLLAGLLGWTRLYRRFGAKATPSHLFALAFGVFVLTAIGEAAWYGLASGIDPWRVLNATLRPHIAIRPAWWVLLAGLVLWLLAWWRRRPA
jgi:sulfoxide reductase heme-binding subunit YedZ